MSSGVTDFQRSSHSDAERPDPRCVSSSIVIASPPSPVMRTTCSSFGSRSRTAAILASCSSSSTITTLESEFSRT